MSKHAASEPDLNTLIPHVGHAVYLTASLLDARRIQNCQGGRLFRWRELYLIGTREEVREWGWKRTTSRHH